MVLQEEKNMINVIVVPETEEFQLDVSHRNVVWINKNLGVPRLKDRDARYLAPYWTGQGGGVNRVYHIVDDRDVGDSTEIELGNSFVLRCRWMKIGQNRCDFQASKTSKIRAIRETESPADGARLIPLPPVEEI